MTNCKRTPFLHAGVLGLALAGCGDSVDDFIDAQGSYADGTPIAFHEQMRRFSCDAVKAEAPCVSLMGLKLTADVSELLRGVKINYIPSKMSGVSTTYMSGIFEPVTLYIVQAKEDRFVDSTVAGGELKFTTLATMPGETTAGTFRDMVLTTGIEEDTHTLLTLTSGSFQYLQP